MCTEQTSKAGIDLITAELKPIYSCLDMESSVSYKVQIHSQFNVYKNLLESSKESSS